MNWFKPVLKWLAIVVGILGLWLYADSLYSNFTSKDLLSLEPVDWSMRFALLCFVLAAVCFVFYRFGSHLRWLKLIFKWMGIVIGFVVVLLALFLVEEHIRGKIALRSYMRELRARGETLTLADMRLPRPGSKGEVEWFALTNQFASLRKDGPFPPDAFYFARIRLVASGRAIVRTKQPDLGVNRISVSSQTQTHSTPIGRGRGRSMEDEAGNYTPSAKADWSDLDTQLNRASNVLEKIGTLLREQPLTVDLDYSQGSNLKVRHLGVASAAANWFGLATLQDLHRRELDAATTNLLTIAALMRIAEDDRLLISQISRCSTGSKGLSLTWEALQSEGWADDQLLALGEAWQEGRVIQKCPAALEMERIFHRDIFKEARHVSPWSELRRIWEPLYLSEFFSNVRVSIQDIAWPLAWSDQDELRFQQRYQHALDRARSAMANRDWSAVASFYNDLSSARNFYDRQRFLLSDSFMWIFEDNLKRVFEYETQREMTVAAIAIKRYQLRTGKLPLDLKVLVPEYVPQLPHDWMDGQPLRYRLDPGGTFTLYSVGEDDRDDGGDPTPMVGRFASTIWQERDAVWPLPATPEEIAEAQAKHWLR